MPVTVIISKNPEAARAKMDSMLLGGLGRAASVALESTYSDSIEQLVGSEEGEAQIALQGARAVLNYLKVEQEVEGREKWERSSRVVSVAGALGLVGTSSGEWKH